MKFKNIRWPSRATKAGIVVEPPTKKVKLTEETDENEDNNREEGYEKNLQYLKKLWKSKKWSLPVILELVEQTATGRRKWIVEDCPPVSEFFECFPCFADPRIVSLVCLCLDKFYLCACFQMSCMVVIFQMINEFCIMTGATIKSIEEKWSVISSNVLKYSRIETRKSVKKLITRFDEYQEEENSGNKTFYCVYYIAFILSILV